MRERQPTRRELMATAAACAALSILTRRAFAKDDDHAALYAKDVEFLLKTFEEKAGHFFKLKEIDWKKVATQFRAEVKTVRTDADHVKLCSRLVARLRDGHATLTDLKVKPTDESNGRKWTGPRVHLLVVGEKPGAEKVYVRAAFGEASEQGVAAGMEVLEIDRAPARRWLADKVAEMRDLGGYSTDHAALYAACHWGLADWAGTKIAFELKDGSSKKFVELVRNGGTNFVPDGPLFPPAKVETTGRQRYGRTAGGFGYVHLRDVPGELPDQLDTMLGAIGDVPGLVLDMRANGGGGCDHQAVFGRFLAAGQKWEPNYVGCGKANFTGPMVVVVDAGVRSAGETVAGQFKEDGRAFMIGDTPTHGMSSEKETVPVPSGLFSAYFSVRSNKQRFNGGRGIEGIGVAPHEVVPYQPSELANGIDTQIRRAEELLKSGFPKGRVAWRPPEK